MDTEPKRGCCECGCGNLVNVDGKRFIQGHHNHLLRKPEDRRPLPLCACGCGEAVTNPDNRFVSGHHLKCRPKRKTGLSLCACGCGREVNNTWVKGHHNRHPDYRSNIERMNKARIGSKHTEETRKKMSEAKKRFFASGGKSWNAGLTKDVHPSIGLCQGNRYQSAADYYDRFFPSTATCLEVVVQIALWQRGIPFLFNVPVRHICRPDFLFPDARIALQVDGAHWHQEDQKEEDAAQDAELEAAGWGVFRWKEKEIKTSLGRLIDLLESAYRSRI